MNTGFKFQKGNQINKGRTSWNKGRRGIPFTIKYCIKCGGQYHRNNNIGNDAWLKREFCSKSCKSKGNKTNLGRKHTKETKRKMSDSHLKGELSPYWIKDRTKLKRYGDPERDRRSYAYNSWKKSVLKRDSSACCIHNEDCNGRIEVHHILSYTDYPELRYQINNGITLCHAHHPRKRAEEKRLEPLFKELVSVSKE